MAEVASLKERAARGEQALVATQAGARNRVKQLIQERDVLQRRVEALEQASGGLGSGLGGGLVSLLDTTPITTGAMRGASAAAPPTSDVGVRRALEQSRAEATQQRTQCEALAEELRAAQEHAAALEREMAGRADEWGSAKARAVGGEAVRAASAG